MEPDPYTIHPNGYFNASQSTTFRDQIQEAIKDGVSLVRFECQDILLIDSSGLGELVLAYKSLRQAGIQFILCSINDQIEMLLSITGMQQVFEIEA